MPNDTIPSANPSYSPKPGNNQTRPHEQTSSPHQRAPRTTPTPHTPPRGRFHLSPSHPLNLTRSTPYRNANPHAYSPSPQLQISPSSDGRLRLSNDDMHLDLGWDAPLRLSPPWPLAYTSPELHIRRTINPSTGAAYTGESRPPTDQHRQKAALPGLVPHDLEYQHDLNSGGGLAANQPNTQTGPDLQANLDRNAYGAWEQNWSPAPRLGANEPSAVPSSIAHTLPALQANLDHHSRSASAGHLSPPRQRYISSAITVNRPDPFANPGYSIVRAYPLATTPAPISARTSSHQTPIAEPRPHRNRGAQPPHANREFFFYWLRKHDVVQLLPGPQKLLTESALVRLHGMGKEVLDIYELTRKEWEELGVSRFVGQRLRGAVLEFTREKGMVLEEFMQKGERDGWFMPFEGRDD